MTKELLYQNKKIFYQIIGSGKRVLFIHGFGENGTVWKNQIDFLKNDFQLIIPDLPGTGKSEMIGDMSIEGMADVIKEIVNVECLKVSPQAGPDLEGTNVSLIGHSMGGYITLAFAEKYPGYLNSFGLFHSTAYPDNDEKKMARIKGIEFIEQHGAFEFLKNVTVNLFSTKTRDERKEFIDQFINELNNFSSPALVSYYKAMMQRPDRTNALKKATIPILFIIGEQDSAVPLQDSLRLCHLPEKAYIHILSHSGHMGMLEEANESNRVLKIFFTGNMKINLD